MSVAKLWMVYLGVILTGIASFWIMIFASVSPEQLIVGEWVEDSWEYERINKQDDKKLFDKTITDDEKHLISQNLIFHKAEVWRFQPYGKLKLIGDRTEKNVVWKLKGRGHILKLSYMNDEFERYNITELNDTILIINFESELEARGIAKLTFKRKKK